MRDAYRWGGDPYSRPEQQPDPMTDAERGFFLRTAHFAAGKALRAPDECSASGHRRIAARCFIASLWPGSANINPRDPR